MQNLNIFCRHGRPFNWPDRASAWLSFDSSFLWYRGAAFTAAFYLVQLKGKTREVIKFEGDMIVIEQYTRGKTSCLKANKRWVLVRLQRPKTPLEVLRLYVSYSGKSIELGSFLNESEKSKFANLLKNALS